MKKLNTKLLTIAFMILSVLTAGGLSIRHAIAPGSNGLDSEDLPLP